MKFLRQNGARSEGGFTLIELASVVVVISLLIGGILAIRNVREGGERARVLKEGGEYVQLFEEFKERYNYWPGDYPGDGSAKFDGISGNGDGIYNTSPPEGIYAWQQLQAVGMYNPQMSAADSSVLKHFALIESAQAALNTESAIPGDNTPNSKIAGGGWVPVEFFVSVVTDTYFTNVLRLGLYSALNPLSMENGIITPQQLYTIDFKADDGFPESGKIMGTSPSTPAGGVTAGVTAGGGGLPGACVAACGGCP